MKILITGVAGFIGSAVATRLLERGEVVLGIDNLNNYYDVNLKLARLELLKRKKSFKFVELDISNREAVKAIFQKEKFQKVIHLAAQAGVRYSIENPHAYMDSNIIGFINILEGCRHYPVEHLTYASSSSVYGANSRIPFSVQDNVDHPVSLYAASKKANELMAHAYSHIYKIPTTGLRFFTVYGPWGRPDMSYFKFTYNILNGNPIDVFNYGQHRRDFTYIDDIVEGVIRVNDKPAQPNVNWTGESTDPRTSLAPYRVYNIGNNKPINLLVFIETLEKCLGRVAEKKLLPMQPGDVPDTYADVSDLVNDFGYKPDTSLFEGVNNFVKWYKSYY